MRITALHIGLCMVKHNNLRVVKICIVVFFIVIIFCSARSADALVNQAILRTDTTELTIGGPVEIDTTAQAWRFSWGPKAAFHLFFPGDLTSSVDFEGYEFGYGCSVGVNLRFIHKTNWLLQTGFSIGYDNAPIQMVPVVPIYGDAAWPSHSLHQGTMVLPVQAGYIFNYGDDLGFGIMTGVEGSFGFAGALSTPRGERHYDLYGDNGVFRRWNVSWVTGFLIELPPTITVGIDGSFGLLNVARQPVFRFKAMNETYVRISMTYWLK